LEVFILPGDGQKKGIATILFEVSSIFFGMFGLLLLWITSLFSGKNNSKNN